MNPTSHLILEIPLIMMIGFISGYVCTGILYPMKVRYNGDPVAILPVFILLCFGIVGTLILFYTKVLPHAQPFGGDSATVMVALTAMVVAYFPGAGTGILKPVFTD